ncbi:MAG: DUF1702 family protein [Methylococcales bacterium]|nr:DUF1702 family protein [Methylococcales bacterium]
MTRISGSLRRRLFGIDPAETRVSRRGFDVADPQIKSRIETIGATFVGGYHAALLNTDPMPLSAQLDGVEPELRGFAYEGAGMGLTLADFFSPRRRYFQAFLDGPGENHLYMLHVGAGWARARLPFNPESAMQDMDPLLKWLVLDGYGFHQGYFYWRRFIGGQEKPRKLSAYGYQAFDQGLGRSLWFVHGARIGQMATTLAGFATPRRAALWSGVGLAAAYAGGVDAGRLQELRALAGDYRPQLAQGAAFAAKARLRAGNPAAHTALACEIICGVSAETAARATDAALLELPADSAGQPAYEAWRRKIQLRFACAD